MAGNKDKTRRIAIEEAVENMDTWIDCKTGQCSICSGNIVIARSRYRLGEVVAIAQPYKDIHQYGTVPTWVPSPKDPTGFVMWDESAGYNNKLYVCADFMPHHIRIESITVERLQDISDKDCLREGVYELESTNNGHKAYTFIGGSIYRTPREAFAALIDKVSRKGTWQRNPFVWVYTFTRID